MSRNTFFYCCAGSCLGLMLIIGLHFYNEISPAHSYSNLPDPSTIHDSEFDDFPPPQVVITKEYSQNEKIEWLRIQVKKAKTEGYAAYLVGMYYLEKDDHRQSELWLKQAYKLGYQPAVMALSRFYYSLNQYDDVKALLKEKRTYVNSKDEIEAFNMLIDIAVSEGDLHYILSKENTLKKTEHLTLYKSLQYFQIIPSVQSSLYRRDVSCEMPVQFLATNMHDLNKSQTLIENFNHHSLSAYFCFYPVKYISSKQLVCDPFIKDKAIKCDISLFEHYPLPLNTRYITLVLPKGKANVQAGVMYLASHDTQAVFEHEISHWLGFIDEYPLSPNHAVCLEPQEELWAHNVATLPALYEGTKKEMRSKVLANIPWAHLIKDETPIFIETQQGLRLGTPITYASDVGVFPSDTCLASKVKSFKPVYYRTSLMNNELEFPEVYLQLVAKAPYRFRMPNYHYNVLKATD